MRQITREIAGHVLKLDPLPLDMVRVRILDDGRVLVKAWTTKLSDGRNGIHGVAFTPERPPVIDPATG
jgi:hypothetical protein